MCDGVINCKYSTEGVGGGGGTVLLVGIHEHYKPVLCRCGCHDNSSRYCTTRSSSISMLMMIMIIMIIGVVVNNRADDGR